MVIGRRGNAVKKLLSMSIETKLGAAVDSAQRTANLIRLPQTVYRNADSCGWWHTNPFASLLSRAEVHATILPESYFI